MLHLPHDNTLPNNNTISNDHSINLCHLLLHSTIIFASAARAPCLSSFWLLKAVLLPGPDNNSVPYNTIHHDNHTNMRKLFVPRHNGATASTEEIGLSDHGMCTKLLLLIPNNTSTNDNAFDLRHLPMPSPTLPSFPACKTGLHAFWLHTTVLLPHADHNSCTHHHPVHMRHIPVPSWHRLTTSASAVGVLCRMFHHILLPAADFHTSAHHHPIYMCHIWLPSANSPSSATRKTRMPDSRLLSSILLSTGDVNTTHNHYSIYMRQLLMPSWQNFETATTTSTVPTHRLQ